MHQVPKLDRTSASVYERISKMSFQNVLPECTSFVGAANAGQVCPWYLRRSLRWEDPVCVRMCVYVSALVISAAFIASCMCTYVYVRECPCDIFGVHCVGKILYLYLCVYVREYFCHVGGSHCVWWILCVRICTYVNSLVIFARHSLCCVCMCLNASIVIMSAAFIALTTWCVCACVYVLERPNIA